MYIVRILISDEKPFDVALDIQGLHPFLCLLSKNRVTYFKVFLAGSQLRAASFGWGEIRGWVDRFPHEEG